MITSGSTVATKSKYLLDDDATAPSVETINSDSNNDDKLSVNIATLGDISLMEIDLDDIFVSATTTKLCHDIDDQHLSKVWHIDLEAVKQTGSDIVILPTYPEQTVNLQLLNK